MIKLATADYAWPLLPHEAVLGLAKALEFEGREYTPLVKSI